MKNVEIKLDLSNNQIELFNHWTKELRWVWNFGLELLLESHQHIYYQWMFKQAEKQGIDMGGVQVCHLEFPKQSAWGCNGSPSDKLFERLDNTLEEFAKSSDSCWRFTVTAPQCRIAVGRNQDYYPVRPALLRSPRCQGFLSGYLTSSRCNQYRKLYGLPPLSVPSKLISGLLDKLRDAWNAYKNTKLINRHRPKWKSARNPINYLYTNQSESIKLKHGEGVTDTVALPGKKLFGAIRIVANGLTRRLRDCKESVPRQAQIIAKPSGYYLILTMATQPEARLTGLRAKLRNTSKSNPDRKEALKQDIEALEPAVRIQSYLPPSDKAVGIDPGITNLITTDSGARFAPASTLSRTLNRLRRLQRKASRQIPGSNSQKRTYRQIALIWEKISRSRNAFNHKISTKLVREYGAIAFEDTQLQNLIRRPKAKLREDGKGYAQNKAKAKAGLNRKFSEVSIGDLRSKIEQKCSDWGRKFVRSPAHYSSQECWCCGQKGDRRTQSDFYCLNQDCKNYGDREHADTNAARNLLIRAKEAEPDFFGKQLSAGSYRAWAWEVKRGRVAGESSVTQVGNQPHAAQAVSSDQGGLPLEATLGNQVAPEPEYGSQSLNKKRSART